MAVSKQPLAVGAKAQFFNLETGKFEKVIVTELAGDMIKFRKRDTKGRPNGPTRETGAAFIGRAKRDVLPAAREVFAKLAAESKSNLREAAKAIKVAKKEARFIKKAQTMFQQVERTEKALEKRVASKEAKSQQEAAA